MCESPPASFEKWHTYFRCHLRGLNRCLWPFLIIQPIWREAGIMDPQSVTLLPFNRVNYILSVAGAISAGDCNCLDFFFLFFICIGSKFMKFQWSLICLHWFILTADLWNFNFLFILRLLEMEPLSGNWLQWMEMIWSVWKQMRFALRGFAVKIPIWFGLVWSTVKMVSTSACVFSILSATTGTFPACAAAAWLLSIPPFSMHSIQFELLAVTEICSFCVSSAEQPPDEVITCVDTALNRIHLTDCRCLGGFS